jgi:uncharacterized phage protein gp47/JayE
MAFARPTLQQLVDRTTADLMSSLGLEGAALRRSVEAILGKAIAAVAHGLHGHLDYLSRQMFADLSETEFLERQTSLYGITRAPATPANGNVTLTGTDGITVPAGSTLQRADGASYTTDADATIASETATVAVTADVAGLAGNADAGVTLTFLSPVAGVDATTIVAGGGLIGGTDAQTDTALREQFLERLRQAPQGGSAADYIKWALAAGGTRAWVYEEELGAGTVTVRFVRDQDGSGAAIIPSGGEVSAAQAYIDAHRPVGAHVTVVAPISVALNCTIQISPDTPAIRAAVNAEIEDLLQRVAEPGGTILLSQIRTAIGIAEGVSDFTLTLPAANVTHTTGQIATMGTTTWT